LSLPAIALNVVPLSATAVQISGTVGGVGGVQVTLGDAASGTTTTNNTGAFSITEQNVGVGEITAVGTWGSSKTAVATSLLQDVAANVVVGVNFGPNNAVTINGVVTGNNPGGQTIALTGDVNATVVTNSSGNFSASGTGTTGSTAGAFLLNGIGNPFPFGINNKKPPCGGGSGGGGGGPTITSFSAISGPNNLWTFSGSVQDSNETGITVQLTLPDGTCQSLTCDSSGNFTVALTLAANIQGFASAVATDANNQSSSPAEYMMS
jgi:hypothetical protein